MKGGIFQSPTTRRRIVSTCHNVAKKKFPTTKRGATELPCCMGHGETERWDLEQKSHFRLNRRAGMRTNQSQVRPSQPLTSSLNVSFAESGRVLFAFAPLATLSDETGAGYVSRFLIAIAIAISGCVRMPGQYKSGEKEKGKGFFLLLMPLRAVKVGAAHVTNPCGRVLEAFAGQPPKAPPPLKRKFHHNKNIKSKLRFIISDINTLC